MPLYNLNHSDNCQFQGSCYKTLSKEILLYTFWSTDLSAVWKTYKPFESNKVWSSRRSCHMFGVNSKLWKLVNSWLLDRFRHSFRLRFRLQFRLRVRLKLVLKVRPRSRLKFGLFRANCSVSFSWHTFWRVPLGVFWFRNGVYTSGSNLRMLEDAPQVWPSSSCSSAGTPVQTLDSKANVPNWERRSSSKAFVLFDQLPEYPKKLSGSYHRTIQLEHRERSGNRRECSTCWIVQLAKGVLIEHYSVCDALWQKLLFFIWSR